MSYKVMLVEHNRLLLEQLAQVIIAAPDMDLVARYKSNTDALGQGRVFAPNIILLDVDIADPISHIEHFAQNFPHAAIICIGEQWQADKTTHYIQAGAKGYLLKPFNYTSLKETIETYTKSGMAQNSFTVTFFSPKGKSGKTTLITNLAVALARKTGEKVGIIDADLQFGDMTVFFDLVPKTTIVEAVRDNEFLSPVLLQECYTQVNDLVFVLCGTKNPSLIDKVDIPSLEEIIRRSKGLFRYLLIDVPAGFNPTSIAAAEMSDVTAMVTMVNGACEIQHMRRALEIFKGWPNWQNRVKPIITRVEPCNDASLQIISKALDFPVENIIPNAYMVVSKAADSGRLAIDIEPDGAFSKKINDMVTKVIHHSRTVGRTAP